MKHLPFPICLLALSILFPAATLRAGKLRSDAETARALPPEWRNVAHLPDGFPSDFQPVLAARIPDGKGGALDLSQPPSAGYLAELRRRAERGELFDYYFLPRDERFRKGPGLTGDELLADLKSGKFPSGCKHSNFIYGFWIENVRRYHFLYRVSGDAYYAEQTARYADAALWLLEHRPEQFLPAGRRAKPPGEPMAAIPHEPAALANFFPLTAAARLLLEEARADNAPAGDERVRRARRYLETAVKWMDSKINGPFPETFGRARRNRPAPAFTPGPTTKQLVETYRLPPRAAFTIEYTPWNQTFFYFVTLAAAAEALEDLGAIEKTDRYAAHADLYQRICRVAMERFQVESDCAIRDGKPYLFHRHTPLRDGANEYRLGHPVFGAEDLAHSKSGALNLPYLWEAGPEYGCTGAILAGYANAMAHTLADPTATKKGKDQPWPRSHLDSPWYLAATGRARGPAPRLANGYYSLLAFAPELLTLNRRYTRNDAGRGNLRELMFLYAGYLYRNHEK